MPGVVRCSGCGTFCKLTGGGAGRGAFQCSPCLQAARAGDSASDAATIKVLAEAPVEKIAHTTAPKIRACPKCGKLIEHDTQGCRRVTCSHCNTDFCFICLKVPRPHHDDTLCFYSCPLSAYMGLWVPHKPIWIMWGLNSRHNNSVVAKFLWCAIGAKTSLHNREWQHASSCAFRVTQAVVSAQHLTWHNILLNHSWI